jgi:2-iminobutanoate/2-iminopropanoate deaminase
VSRLRAPSASLALVLLAACADPAPQPPDVEHIPVRGGDALPFSAAVRVGPMLYLSGQIGTDSTGRLVPGGIEAETRQTLENIRAVLEEAGSSMDRVVKCTAMLADISEWSAMNRVYVAYFRNRLPARSAFGASGLALGARIELECWAVVAPTGGGGVDRR